VDTREAAQRWANVWEQGWPEHDTDAVAALYAESVWQRHPFTEREPGYLARVFAEEESARCEFGPPIVDGDRAAVTWSAGDGTHRRRQRGARRRVALRFDEDGLVIEQRDIWVGR
jgi:hypothetical protein